ncbi:hypothetical protein OC846_006326 [Tilletia horrida]|uniref:Protein kinase domain-containing protein n=1 Tax=Tilletia horrida TaxID=155126 RepID=A0AAN6JP31_9BASI|nr:hypothetical protein OC846_006326 [Tilletia horrida]KAK0561242.1 hypothetical protein OC861_005909 [Tilletia horrida]
MNTSSSYLYQPAAAGPSSRISSGGSIPTSRAAATAKHKAALASAYQELSKELLASSQLKTVGNYTLGRPIAEGTFGKVRLATHRLTSTRVAIKQIPKSHPSSQAAAAALTREIHHHRRLHHPHVIQLYEVLATESSIWMVSELCAGGELYDYLVERGVLPEAEAQRLFGQLCLAVAYIHDRGIVHRDLKLENVLLDEMCNVKLGDFGFTREYERRKLMDTFCGTTGYAAPEMLAGKKYTGQEVDIWSLGIILYALVTGSLPFDDDDEDVMRLKILQGDYVIPDELSEDAKDLIRSILKQNPNERLGIRAILSHPWFTRMPQPPPGPVHSSSFGTANSDAGSFIAAASSSAHEVSSAVRERPASRTAGLISEILPPTTEVDDERSNTSTSLLGRDENEGVEEGEEEPVSDEPDVGVHHDIHGNSGQLEPGEPGTSSLGPNTLSHLSNASFVSAVSVLDSITATSSIASTSTSTRPSIEDEEDGDTHERGSALSVSTSPTTEEGDEDAGRSLEEVKETQASDNHNHPSSGGVSTPLTGASTKAIQALPDAHPNLPAGGERTRKLSANDASGLRMLRNESQTTIRRKDSMGSGASDQSRRASAASGLNFSVGGSTGPSVNSAASGSMPGGAGNTGITTAGGPSGIGGPLPTHPESPSSPSSDFDEQPEDSKYAAQAGAALNTANENQLEEGDVTLRQAAPSSSPLLSTAPDSVDNAATTATDVMSGSTSGVVSAPISARKDGGESGLAKGHSQNSSMSLTGGPGTGHFRTPSRTKRRSASSIALSIADSGTHHQHPLHQIGGLGSASSFARVDYVSLMTQLQPTLFSTPLEQRLLVQLSTLGMDVGQIVHSVTTDACDASGAMWWILKKKAEERERDKELELETGELPTAGTAAGGLSTEESPTESAGLHVNTTSSSSLPSGPTLKPSQAAAEGARTMSPPLPPTPHSGSLSPPPPPIPPKDPARQRFDSGSLSSHTATGNAKVQSEEPDGLPKSAQDSFREHLSRLPGSSAMAALKQLEREKSLAAVSGQSNRLVVSQSESCLSPGAQPSDASGPPNTNASGRASFSVTERSSSAAAPAAPTKVSVGSPLRVQAASASDVKTPSMPTPASAKESTSTSNPPTPVSGTPTKVGSRPKRGADRQRTNSLSIRTFANAFTSKGNAADSAQSPAGETTYPERAKSPVSALFSRRGPSSLIVKAGQSGGSGSASSKAPESAKSSLSSAAPKPDPFAASIARATSLSGKKSEASMSSKPAVSVRSQDAVAKPSPATVASPSTPQKSIASVKQQPGKPKNDLPSSVSQDTFSTVNSESYEKRSRDRGEDAQSIRKQPRRPKSSFLSTVRTWLNADERQAKKQRKKKSSNQAAALAIAQAVAGQQHSPSLRGSGSVSHSRTNSASVSGSAARTHHGGTGSIRGVARQNPYPPVSPTARRSLIGSAAINSSTTVPSLSNRGSVSRRSSTGSTILPGHLSSTINAANLPNVAERPTNLRRQSAGSITPTGTLYGDPSANPYEPSGSSSLFAALAAQQQYSTRGSRPSSMHSFSAAQQLHPRRLPAKSGSVSSASSLRRPHEMTIAKSGSNPGSFNGGNGNSLKSLHSRRLSADGGTVVVRRHKSGYGLALGVQSSHRHHRTGSGHSRASSPGPSMLGEIARERDGEEDAEAAVKHDAGASPSHSPPRTRSGARATSEGDLLSVPTSSLPGQDGSDVSKAGHPGSGATSPVSTQGNHYSTLFVAHKSRSPYKPPSANHALQGMIHRASVASASQNQKQQMSNHAGPSSSASNDGRNLPLGTWHRSWGRPPPGWTGPIDDSPVTALTRKDSDRKIRDVFARPQQRRLNEFGVADDEEEWVDEEEEPSYCGGLGQLDASKMHGVWGLSRLGNSAFANGPSTSTGAALAPGLSSPLPGRGFRQFEGLGSRDGPPYGKTSQAFQPMGGSAALRGLFAPPSLGSDIHPRTTVIAESQPTSTSSVGASKSAAEDASGEVEQKADSDLLINASPSTHSPDGDGTSAASGAGSPNAGTPFGIIAAGSRRPAAAASAFVSIEEGEEEED